MVTIVNGERSIDVDRKGVRSAFYLLLDSKFPRNLTTDSLRRFIKQLDKVIKNSVPYLSRVKKVRTTKNKFGNYLVKTNLKLYSYTEIELVAEVKVELIDRDNGNIREIVYSLKEKEDSDIVKIERALLIDDVKIYKDNEEFLLNLK